VISGFCILGRDGSQWPRAGVYNPRTQKDRHSSNLFLLEPVRPSHAANPASDSDYQGRSTQETRMASSKYEILEPTGTLLASTRRRPARRV